MKLVSVIQLLAFLVLPAQASLFGKYPSKTQARSACWEWMGAGGYFEVEEEKIKSWYFYYPDGSQGYKSKKTGEYEWRKINRRGCKHESDTNQYLGSETNIKKNKKVSRDFENLGKWQIKKHFYY